MDHGSPSMLKPALIGGGVAGVIAGLPYLDLLNLCTCCSIVVLGGFLASWLYSKECRAVGQPFRPGTGALVGFIAALFYAVAVTIVSTVVTIAVGQPAMKAFLEAMLEWGQSNPDFPPDALDQIEDALTELDQARRFQPVKTIVGGFFALLLGAVFSTLGGLIGGAVFKHEPPPPRVPEAPVAPSV